ncbi:ring-opening amidohydrolase [Acuticoccus kandeliae]|uniref:cyanuric acid amidohydrolase n=1 Tax=Acuticoccus kandeliae TaxID=2073160 RepID=UPI000D3E646E|nr:ring-opening amidohydrolase [Acuticoccus kandeliae]
MNVDVHKIAMASPDDVSGLAALIEAGTLDPRTIVAVIGKTEGNGGANDFTRALATVSFTHLLAPWLGVSPAEVAARIAFVWSGGTEGVLSPHATIFTRTEGMTADGPARLVLGIGFTRDILPEEVGTLAHVDEVAGAVRTALADAGITDPADVHYVQVKGPLLSPAKIMDADARGATLVTRDPNGSKPFARGAMALGVATALGEVDRGTLTAGAIAHDMALYSTVASTSAGGELTKCEILLFGNAPGSASRYRIGHAVLKDAIDAAGVAEAISNAADGGEATPAAIFAKAEAAPKIRGRRTTMLSDADINYERHARAAVGAVIGSVTGDTAIFLSGGTEHQCLPGEAPIAVIVSI